MPTLKSNKGRHCKNCEDRHLGCHIDCFAYQVEVAKHKAKYDEALKEVKAKNDMAAYGVMMHERIRRKRNAKY